MGKLDWNSGAFPNPAQNIATLASNGFKTVLIHEPYVNNAQANYTQGASLKYLMADQLNPYVPSTVSGFFCTAAYVDFNNPAARGWWFDKLKPRINEGNAAQWVDLGEPEYDDWTTLTDYSYDGKTEYELHNVYSLLWHQALAEGYATNYPNQRLWIYSRSGFAGDQRFGAAHWSNDVGTDWPTLAAHLNAMNNFSLSGFSYFGSDIGGYWPTNIPNDELYLRWFQYGAFSPVFRAHGLSEQGFGFKAVAPYDFTNAYVREICRVHMKLRYRLLPYIYTAAEETLDTGLPMCRPLPLAFPSDPLVVNNGTQFMFGPNLMVTPITTEGLTSRSVYLPAGKWIDHWTGAVLTGPITTNWPAPLTQIPLFWRDNSITPLGPYVDSTQFDDGTQRALRIYCSTNAACTLYDDDGASNGFRSNEFAHTSINVSRSGNIVDVQIGGASGSYSNQPSQRAWGIELFCTNAVFNVVADGTAVAYDLNAAERLLRINLPSAPVTQSHSVQVYLDLAAPAPYGARIKAVDRPYLDKSGAMWAADQAYTAGSFGFTGGGSTFLSTAPIENTDDDLLFQSERYNSSFSYQFDAPNGRYEVRLLNAETYHDDPGERLMNVFIEGQQVLTNFDIFAAAGGKNRAVTRTFTNTVADGRLKIDFAGASGSPEPNARVSALAVRKIADADSDNDGMPDWWEDANGLNKNSLADAGADADDDGVSNLNEFFARTNPHDATSALTVTTMQNGLGGFQIKWPSVAGKKYRVFYSDDLQTWTPVVPDVLATGTITPWTDSAPLPERRFYKVQALP